MTLTYPHRSWSVLFTEDYQIKRAWLNDKKVKLTPWREERIWNAFNEAFDLKSEIGEYRYEVETNYATEY